MAATAGFLNKVLDLYMTNLDHTEIGDAAGLQASAAPGSYFISLHTGDPVAGDQETNEATFGAYARQTVARSGAGFTVAGANASNAAIIAYLTATSGSETMTHFGIGENVSGAGTLFLVGALDNSRLVTIGTTLEFGIGELDVDLT